MSPPTNQPIIVQRLCKLIASVMPHALIGVRPARKHGFDSYTWIVRTEVGGRACQVEWNSNGGWLFDHNGEVRSPADPEAQKKLRIVLRHVVAQLKQPQPEEPSFTDHHARIAANKHAKNRQNFHRARKASRRFRASR